MHVERPLHLSEDLWTLRKKERKKEDAQFHISKAKSSHSYVQPQCTPQDNYMLITFAKKVMHFTPCVCRLVCQQDYTKLQKTLLLIKHLIAKHKAADQQISFRETVYSE